VVLGGVERAERAVPLAVEQADAVAVEDVEDLRAGARARAGGAPPGLGSPPARPTSATSRRRTASAAACPDLSRR